MNSEKFVNIIQTQILSYPRPFNPDERQHNFFPRNLVIGVSVNIHFVFTPMDDPNLTLSWTIYAVGKRNFSNGYNTIDSSGIKT